MSDAQDSRKRRRIDQTNKPDKPDKPELNVEWTNLQRVWLKRVQRLFEDFGPPQPSLELKRREEVMELRRRLSDKYAELIETWKISLRSNSETSSTDSPTLSSLPREAFNRWLMERINAGGTDPLLGGQADASLLKAAAKGLEHDLCRPLHSEAAPKDFENFAEKVRSLCSWLASEADAAAERIARSVESARSASQTSKVSATLNAKRGCYVFSLDQSYSSKLGEQAVVEAESESNESDANSSSFTLSPSALARLAKLMRRATRWAEKISRSHVAGEAWAGKFHAFMQQDASFWDITFCLLCRYDALCGPGHKEGGGFHAAIPSVAFDVLEKMDDVNDVPVRVECFASPQLCHAEWHFCSAFRDVDIFFGSLGPFLDEEMDIGRFGGIYEVNPPFVRGVVLQLARKLLRALELAESEDRSLCIFLVLPGLASHKLFSDISEPNEKLEDELDALDRLLRCRFRRALHASSRRAYTNGLAFKTERSWPLFAVPTTLVLLSSQPSEHEVADFERLCTSWGHSEQDITDDIMRERCEKRV